MKQSLQLFLGACLVAGLSGCGGSTPPPKTDTQIANDFFKSLRTQVSSIIKLDDNSSNGFLDTEAEKLGEDLKNVTLNASLAGKYLGAIVGTIAEAMDENSSEAVKENVEEGRNVSIQKQPNFHWDYTINENNTELGRGTVVMPGDDLNLTLEDDSNLSFLVVGTLPLYRIGESSDVTGKQSAKAEIVLSKESYGALSSIKELSLVGNGASVKLSDFTIKSFYEDIEDINYSIFEGVKVDMTAGEYAYNGVLTVPSYVSNDTLNGNNGYLPEKIVYHGMIQNSTTGAKLDADLAVTWLDAKSMNFDTEQQDPHLKVTLTGDLQRPSMPETKIVLGYDDPLTSDSKIVTFAYAYDKTNVEGKGVFDKEMDNGKVIISGNDGIEAVVKVVNGDVVYGEENSYVTRNGTKIGYLTERNSVPVIMYNDGTFESLQ